MNNPFKDACGSTNKEFREKAKSKLDEWFGGEDKYEIMFTWFDKDIAYVTVRTEQAAGYNWIETFYFFRLFEMNGIMEISQDKIITK